MSRDISEKHRAIIAYLEAARAEDLKGINHPSGPPWMYQGTRGGWRPQREIRRAIYGGWSGIYRWLYCGSLYRSLAGLVKRGLIQRDVINPRDHKLGVKLYPRLNLPPSKQGRRAILLYAALNAPDLRFLDGYKLETECRAKV
jgi:hypothetical protein